MQQDFGGLCLTGLLIGYFKQKQIWSCTVEGFLIRVESCRGFLIGRLLQFIFCEVNPFDIHLTTTEA